MAGIASGILVAGGLFTLFTTLGVVQRLMAVSETENAAGYYQWVMIAGCIFGNCVWLWPIQFKVSEIIAGVTGLLIGIYAGCLIGAIAEVLDALPIGMKRIGILKDAWIFIVVMAAGKTTGAYIWYILN